MNLQQLASSTIGKTGSGEFEFGEVYHAVVAKRLNEDYFPKIDKFDDGKEFYQLFHIYAERRDLREIHPAVTAGWIFDGFHGGIQAELWRRLSRLADAGSWEQQMPDSFKGLYNEKPKVLVWIRKKNNDEKRNMNQKACEQLARLCRAREAEAVFIGTRIDGFKPEGEHLWDFYCDPWFKTESVAKQLWFLNILYEKHGVIASVGMMSGALDGLTMFCGKKVLFLATKEDASPRMAKVSMVVPSLHWVELFYKGDFQHLSDGELGEIEKRVFG